MAVAGRNYVRRPFVPFTGATTGWTDTTGKAIPTGSKTDMNTAATYYQMPVTEHWGPVHARLAGGYGNPWTEGQTVRVWIKAASGGSVPIRVSFVSDYMGDPDGTEPLVTLTTDETVTVDVTVPADGYLGAYLRLSPDGPGSGPDVSAVRLDMVPDASAADLGIFDGDTVDTATVSYGWAGEPHTSVSEAVTADVPDPDPDPDPDPEPTDLAANVAAFLGRPGDVDTIALATVHAGIVTGYVYGYTRGKGFTESGVPKPDLTGVITAATARLTGNPEQVTYYVSGDYSERPAVLAGWTLPELAVLNRYRRRFA